MFDVVDVQAQSKIAEQATTFGAVGHATGHGIGQHIAIKSTLPVDGEGRHHLSQDMDLIRPQIIELTTAEMGCQIDRQIGQASAHGGGQLFTFMRGGFAPPRAARPHRNGRQRDRPDQPHQPGRQKGEAGQDAK